MQPRQGNPSTDVVGELDELVEIDAHKNGYTTFNDVDACIFLSHTGPDGKDLLDRYGSIRHLGIIPRQPVLAVKGMQVSKSGMVTGLTQHVVESVTAEYMMPWGNKWARFLDQIALTMPPYINEGDSGSLVVATANKAPVGLLAAVKLVSMEPETWIALANKIQNVLDSFPLNLEIVGSAPVAAAAEPASEYPQNPCSWMHDGNPRLEKIKQIQERLSEHLRARLKPGTEFVSLMSLCDDQGEPYFNAGINPDRIEVVQEKGLPDVWEDIPVKYVPMQLHKMIK
jgi:hypothetical protein